MRTIYFVALFGLLLAGCMPFAFGRSAGPLFNREFSSNGERIYLTSTNERGEFIRYTGGPGPDGMMMGGALTCAACHGADGRGGVHTMHMRVMDAPDIRYAALSGESGGHEDDHGDEQGEYTLDDFRMAVVEGRHPDGEPLSPDMPRWQLNDEDLADLFEYLKTLP